MATVTTEARCGRRVLKAGQTVRVAGWRGTYTIQEFRETATGVNVWLFGGPRQQYRACTLDRIGARPRRVEVRS